MTFIRIAEEVKYQMLKFRDLFEYYYFYRRKIWIRCNSNDNAILVIRLDAIGDCILWLDQAKEYRKAFPNQKLILLCNSVWKEIAQALPFDEIIPFDRKNIENKKYRYQILKAVNKYRYKIVFNPIFSRDFYLIDWFVHNVHADEKFGYVGDYQNDRYFEIANRFVRSYVKTHTLKRISDSWYTRLLPNNPESIMELQKNADFTRFFINPNYVSQLPSIPVNPFMQIPIDGNYSVLFMGASDYKKMWYPERFARIVDSIQSNRIVLCGSKSELSLFDTFISNICSEKLFINLIGKTSLLELVEVIRNADLLISNDTAASHISVATRTPSVCILAGGHYGRFHPYKVENISRDESYCLPIVVTSKNKSCFCCNFDCKYNLKCGKWKCIDDITVEDVVMAVSRLTAIDG